MKKLVIISTLLLILACSHNFIPYQDVPADPATLGKELFFWNNLSLDSSISCSSCHQPNHAFADTTAFSTGVGGRLGNRNTPSVTNMAARSAFFWDGRANTLEEQALFPIQNPNEMNLPIETAIERIEGNNYFNAAFKNVFDGKKVSAKLLGKALAAYEETLETSFTPFDRFMEGDTAAISLSAKRGQLLFNEKANCFDCHFSPDFTVDEMHNIGLFDGETLNDSGRYLITKNKNDLGKFKTPGLRNIAKTAPYMHNGMFATLEGVVAYYNNPDEFVVGHQNRDSLIVPLNLNEQEMKDLVAFMKTLSH